MATPRNMSVQKAFRLLGAFQKPDEWLTSAELSRRSGMPEASGYRLIQTLLDIGAVIQDGRGRYGPGMLLVSLSRRVSYDRLLRESSNSILETLAAELGLIVHMGVLDNGMVTYIAKAGENERVRVQTKVGTQLEAYCSGVGKVLLASLPERDLESFLAEGELVPLTPNTITERDAFRNEINTIRRRGWALDNGEIATDLICVAVPVRDQSGTTVAAISSSESADRMNESRISEARAALMLAASEIGTLIGSTGFSATFEPPDARTNIPITRYSRKRGPRTQKSLMR